MTGPQIRDALEHLAELLAEEVAATVQTDARAYTNAMIARTGAKALQRASNEQLERLGRLLK